MPKKSLVPQEGKTAAGVLDALVFYSLLGVIFLAAIPYGSIEPWWKAVVQCLVFALAGLSVTYRMLRGETRQEGRIRSMASTTGQSRRSKGPTWLGLNWSSHKRGVLLPALAFVAFALIQTIPWSSSNLPGVGQVGRTLSADAFQTWLFAIHLTALVLLGWMLVIHTSTERRLRLLVEVLIAIGVLSAIFGMWRQARQREVGFLLPYLRRGLGYAQFINYNHFAFLMEMALGLALGIVVCRGVSGRRLIIYLMAAVPMWLALVLSNSRGGILSLLCQVIFLALLLGIERQRRAANNTPEALGKERRSRSRDHKLFRAGRTVALRGLLIVALLAGAIGTLVFVGGDPLGRRLEDVPLELDQRIAESSTLRQSIWRATWEMIKDHPVVGVGFGGYATAIPKYHRASGEITPQEAHNDYLELIASGGLVALALGIWWAVNFLREARRQVRGHPARDSAYVRAARLGALAGILTVGIHSLVDFGLHIPINALVFTALISIVIINVGDEGAKGYEAET